MIRKVLLIAAAALLVGGCCFSPRNAPMVPPDAPPGYASGAWMPSRTGLGIETGPYDSIPFAPVADGASDSR